jgi:hypothetical protein
MLAHLTFAMITAGGKPINLLGTRNVFEAAP